MQLTTASSSRYLILHSFIKKYLWFKIRQGTGQYFNRHIAICFDLVNLLAWSGKTHEGTGDRKDRIDV
ncbi:hypothetical protein NSP_29030 [Nodularia spumigena CCY9414]|jgi:hypothetical protein|nr:hypothetical protein NSP_29030 [Nodularia spumigena CCY9414]